MLRKTGNNGEKIKGERRVEVRSIGASSRKKVES